MKIGIIGDTHRAIPLAIANELARPPSGRSTPEAAAPSGALAVGTGSAFLSIRKDGFTMRGGLILPGRDVSCAVHIEPDCIPYQITDNHFLMYRPKWWDVRGWLSIARTVLAYLPPSPNAAITQPGI